jgi:predicted murein hydrolase (TIGR00659 family)
MTGSPAALWVYLSSTPLLWLTLTLGVWIGADAVARRAGGHPLVNPVLSSILAIGTVLLLTGTDYTTYFQGAQFVHFLLGPATVAIAVPLARNFELVRRYFWPLLAALLVGSVTAIVSVLLLARLVGLPFDVMVSVAPKSVTAAVAMGISEQTGGTPALTAVLVVLTGIFGSVIVTPMMNALKIRNYAARGFSVGLASHGIGTARAFAVDPVAGTFAGIAMGLNAVLTSFLVPPLLGWLGG